MNSNYQTNSFKNFDLNIDKILENWECKHAVREMIANAIDEQILTNTPDINIYKEGDTWIIRDYGRGIKTEHLTQSENQEKLNTKGIIGKFGIGLKDALATFDRHGVQVEIHSPYVDISVTRTAKNGFQDIETLHATIASPSKHINGTEVHLIGLSDQDMEAAKSMFLKFSNSEIIESNEFGEVIESDDNNGSIYINGVLVAEEPNFLFSYNIKKIDSILRKAINRERSNVGRSAYASTVRKILLNCVTERVGRILSEDLARFSSGNAHDELRWIDVQTHAAKILSNNSKAIFVTSQEAQDNIDLVKEASSHEREVIIIPDNLSKKIAETNKYFSTNDDKKITTLSEFVKERSDNYRYEFIDEEELLPEERYNYGLIDKVYRIIGGKPNIVEKVYISQTMQKDMVSFSPCLGLWEPKMKAVIIHREILRNREKFLGVLLHELAHAQSGFQDATRGFEDELTHFLGRITCVLFSQQ